MKKEYMVIQADWKTFEESPQEIGDTYADVTIDINGWLASRNLDLSDNSVRKCAELSAYPMALWMAFYWWRILYEPRPAKRYSDSFSYSWRTAHDLAASGEGFIWPPLRFFSNGEQVEVESIIQFPRKASPSIAQYEFSGRERIARSFFEKSLDDFIKKTIKRLEAMGHRDTELQKLWPEVEKERNNSDSNLYRIIEALLGFNPDEAPSELVDALADKTEIAGTQAIFEIAAASSIEAVKNPQETVMNIIGANGIDPNRLDKHWRQNKPARDGWY